MKRDRQKGSETKEGGTVVVVGFSDDGSAKGEAVDQRVQCEAEGQTHPAKWMLPRSVAVGLVVMLAGTVVCMVVIVNEIASVPVLVGVNMKHANEQKHREQAAQRPAGNAVDRAMLGK